MTRCDDLWIWCWMKVASCPPTACGLRHLRAHRGAPRCLAAASATSARRTPRAMSRISFGLVGNALKKGISSLKEPRGTTIFGSEPPRASARFHQRTLRSTVTLAATVTVICSLLCVGSTRFIPVSHVFVMNDLRAELHTAMKVPVYNRETT